MLPAITPHHSRVDTAPYPCQYCTVPLPVFSCAKAAPWLCRCCTVPVSMLHRARANAAPCAYGLGQGTCHAVLALGSESQALRGLMQGCALILAELAAEDQVQVDGIGRYEPSHQFLSSAPQLADVSVTAQTGSVHL
ncbi:unnamed protein product [Euphydryas editha]|uniref:Uncharacterized protein n=1 Tax=Euphydryas editha TaxID=104508 RepID=A0AAU9TAN2_EUPED|nr:unnamed protein product [Euphydryas editha]